MWPGTDVPLYIEYIIRVHRVHYRGKFTTASCYANVGNGGKEIGRIVQ